MTENVTRPTDVNPCDFIATVKHPTRRADAEVLYELMGRVSGYQARMWGPTIVGFGRYRYRYDSGREGEYLACGFSPRAAHQVIYTMPGYHDLSDLLNRLGKHRIGKSCLYVNKLSDIHISVLEDIVATGLKHLRATFDTFDE